MSLEFLLTSLVVVVIPGTGVLYTVSIALGRGWRVGLVAAVGCTLGIVPHLLAAMIGLSGIMQAGALAFEVVRYAGVAYLVYIGVSMFRNGGELQFAEQSSDRDRDGGEPQSAQQSSDRDRDGGEPQSAQQSSGRDRPGGSMITVVRRGILLNLLNPKLTAFFFAFLPQFLDSSAGPVDPRLIGLGGVFMLMTVVVFAAYAYASAAVRDRVLRAPVVRRWLQRSLGTLLIGFAAKLAVTDR